MKMELSEKQAFLEYLKNRIFRIERFIGDIDFYGNSKNPEIISFEEKKNKSIQNNSTGDKLDTETKNEEEQIKSEYTNLFDELILNLQNVPLENVHANREELLEIIKKHKHRSSFSIHVCVIKYIIQHIFKGFLCDIYNQYNDFYVYIHSKNVVDVYNTLESKKNILLTHIGFMKNYCNKLKKIEKLKEYINSVQISETEIYLDRLEKIEKTNERLHLRIAEINKALENIAYKYAITMQLASRIILKYKQVFS